MCFQRSDETGALRAQKLLTKKLAGGGSIKHLRMAGGEVWEDMTMDEWDPSELRY